MKSDIKQMEFKDLITVEEFYYWAPGQYLLSWEDLAWEQKEAWRKIFCKRRLNYAKGKVNGSLRH
jgi:hypothetical protein